MILIHLSSESRKPLTRAPLRELTPNRSLMTPQPTSQASNLDNPNPTVTKYVQTHLGGENKGKTLDEVPRSYISWLEKNILKQ